MNYATVQALAEHLDRDSSTIHRALRRWQKEVGARVIVARNGGAQKHVLLEQQDAEEFVTWFLDRPGQAAGNAFPATC
jgi:predicted transcriptional regulator